MEINNKFDFKYEIRLANYNEIDDIMKFIDTYWKKGHILGINRSFFEYEMVVNNQVNFLIAKDKLSNKIAGILGFLPCSLSKDKLDIWGVVWKIVDGAMPMLGMEMKKRLSNIINFRTDLGVGANVNTSVPLLSRIFHYYTAKMKHYYRISKNKEFKIAKITKKIIPNYIIDMDFKIIMLKNINELIGFFDFSSIIDSIPYKDSWYYEKRFFLHPIYKYKIWGLQKNDSKAIMVTKIQICNNSSAVRIVDFIGEQSLFSYIGSFLDYLLIDNEYIDFYFDGFDSSFVEKAGMVELKDDEENIIPDYFYPFEQRNVDIYVVSSNNKQNCLFFKADGDQDRPN